MTVRPVSVVLGIVVPFLMAGCIHQSDEQILEKAERYFAVVSLRYEKLLDTADPEKIILCARSLGTSSYAPTTSWFDFIFKGDSTYREAIPLHTVARFLESDLDDLYSHLASLQTRLLVGLPIYKRLQMLRDGLVQALETIKVDEDYIEEARFIDLKRVEEKRLAAERDQRDYLRKIAERPPYKEEITITEIVKKPSKKHCEVECDETRPVKKPKKEIAEIVVE